MSVERFSRTIPASGVIDLGPGNFMLLLSASAALNLRADGGGTSEGFNSVTGGLVISRVQPWSSMRLIGTPGIACDYVVGQENISEDDTDIRLQIATIAGTASFAEAPSATITASPAAVTVTTATASTIAANLTRRRITVCAPSTNTGSVYIQTVAAGANRGIELQPGTFVEMRTTAAMDIRNDSGASQAFTTFEES